MSKLVAGIGVPVLAALAIAGCGSSSSTSSTSGTSTGSSVPTPSANSAIAAQVPAAIKAKGTLNVAAEAQYAPNEFIAPDGHTVIGMDADLLRAIGREMGLKVDIVNANFASIIPGLAARKYDAGASSFTDTKEREKTVDFVTYFSAGILWGVKAGKTVDPLNACGLTVAVQSTTTEEQDELPAKNKACTKAGKKPIKILPYENQDDAVNSVVLGKTAAFSADSPVTAYAIKQSAGKLVQAGEIMEAAPYGWPIAKGSTLVQAMQKALQSLIDNGTYLQICEKWGVQAGAIKTAAVNGAIS